MEAETSGIRWPVAWSGELAFGSVLQGLTVAYHSWLICRLLMVDNLQSAAMMLVCTNTYDVLCAAKQSFLRCHGLFSMIMECRMSRITDPQKSLS